MLANLLHPGRLLVAVVAATAALVVGAPDAATAVSCASHPDASPEAIAEGTEELAVEGTFREHYDGAIFGTVVSVATQDHGEDHGRTEVVVEVSGTLGPDVGGSAVIVEDDPGWMSGYAFEVGAHYFVPYVENEKGRYSFLCDPIAEVDRADVPGLVELAEKNAWGPAASDDEGPAEQAAGSTDHQSPTEAAGASVPFSGSGSAWLFAPAGLLAACVVAAVRMRREVR